MSSSYRLKHKLTGMYFRPLKGKYSNLDFKGKIYDTDYMYNQLVHPENTAFNAYKTIQFVAEFGRKKNIPSPEFEMATKILNGEYPGVEIVSKYVYERYISLTLVSNPEDWEKELVEVNIKVIDE